MISPCFFGSDHSSLPPLAWVGRGGGGVGLALPRVASSRCRGEDSLPGVGHLGDEPVGVVGGVGRGLDATVRKGDGERTSDIAVGILSLSLLEVSLAVVVGHTVLVGVGLGGKLLLLVRSGGGCVLGGGNSHQQEATQQLKIKFE